MESQRTLILASTSPYRRQLLERLGLPFEVVAPEVDETPVDGETPQMLVRRLAQAKAHAVTRQHPHATIIGSDQVADFNGRILGKPGTLENARAQLESVQGHAVIFRTAVAVLAPGHAPMIKVVPTHVRFRALSPLAIARYLERDHPIDCAGAMRSEALGTTLVDAITSDDPTALVGLPLICVSEMLRQAGWSLP